MRTLVVYESLFGNTHEIADAIGEGIRKADPSAEVTCVAVADATDELVEQAQLLVVGGPTHMRGLTSGMSRKLGLENERKVGHEDRIEMKSPEIGLRDWLGDLATAPDGRRAAAFDTRAPVRMAGGAAKGIGKRLRKRGYELTVEPEGFGIEDTTGPLRDGEIERAREWGAMLVSQRVR